MNAITLRKLLYCLLRPGYWFALRHRVLPMVEYTPVFQGLSFATVIDVGANKGQFAALARYLWPRARLVCFEPLAHPRTRLAKLLRSGDTLHPLALGASAARTEMHVGSAEDSSSLLPLGRDQTAIFGVTEVGTTPVEVQRLDALFPDGLPPDCLLKIDVQGTEREVLQGAGDLLSQAKAVFIEVSYREFYVGQGLDDEIDALLTAAGFEPAGRLNTCEVDGLPVQADLLYTRTGREPSTARQ